MNFFDKLVNGNKGPWTTLWAAAFRSNTALKVAGVSALLLLIVLLPCRASLLAYEGFSYPTGTNLLSLNGGTGWNGGWVDVGGAGGVTVVVSMRPAAMMPVPRAIPPLLPMATVMAGCWIAQSGAHLAHME
jgi:hypothetical protein